MKWRRLFPVALIVVLGAGVSWPLLAQQAPPAGDLNELYEKALKEAARKVAASVVQIQTTGGSDIVVTSSKGPAFRKAMGPTSGVIVDADGFIISSAFNFSNNPTAILVMVPGSKEPVVAKKIATDKSRMLTLLKIDMTGLPVPEFVPNQELKVGQSSLALGRTLEHKVTAMPRDQLPSMSYGIISALGRIWGKAIQTDAKISPINYGGPLVDVTGRVQGIIVPASPRGEDVTAGFEWYDSGIGFAIPMEDVMAAVPKLKKGKDLEKATLGVKLKGQDQFSALPEIASVMPGSAAEKAGLKAGDVITEVEGKRIVNQAQILHLLGPKYVGDSIALKFRRGKDETTVAKLVLVSAATAAKYQHPFLGILAMRDDPKQGVEIRYVYPKSPAEAAGLRPGDRIVNYRSNKDPAPKVLDKDFDKPGKIKKAKDEGKVKAPVFSGAQRGRDELAAFLNRLDPGMEIVLGVVGKDGTARDDIVVKLDAMPGSVAGKNDFVPEKLPLLASMKKALQPLDSTDPKVKPPNKVADDKKPATGLINRTSTAGDRKYWIYVHKDFNPQIAHALVVWLHLPGVFSDEDNEKVTDRWDDFCRDNHIILVGPITEQEGGWTPSDTELVLEAIRDASSNYTIDKNRIVAHGLGNGGQMAFNLGFRARDVIRGVAAVGAIMTDPLENVPGQRLAFYVAAGDRDPIIKAIDQTHNRLVEYRFPVFYKVFTNRGREYLDDDALGELVRWIDSLDRL